MSAMLEILKDLFGINRYTVAWDFERKGIHLRGNYSGRFAPNGMNKRVAKHIAASMNREYRTKGHWIEPFHVAPTNTGEKP
jgi:hypothetical protein